MDKRLIKARKDWAEEHKNHMYSVSTLGWIGKEEVGYYWDGPCHAGLTAPTYYHKNNKLGLKDLVSVFSGIQRNMTVVKQGRTDMERTFLEWLLFHSPFKGGLLPDTAAGAREHRVLMGDVDKPSNLMGAALMSTRIFNEHPKSLEMWWTFVKNGLHPTISFAFAHRLQINSEEKVIEYVPSHTGCFNGNLSSYQVRTPSNEDYLLNFLQGKAINVERPYRESAAGSTSSFKLWCGPNKDAAGAPKVGGVSKLLEKVATGGKESKNPFAKAAGVGAIPAPKLNDALEVLIPYLSKYKEFF